MLAYTIATVTAAKTVDRGSIDLSHFRQITPNVLLLLSISRPSRLRTVPTSHRLCVDHAVLSHWICVALCTGGIFHPRCHFALSTNLEPALCPSKKYQRLILRTTRRSTFPTCQSGVLVVPSFRVCLGCEALSLDSEPEAISETRDPR